MNNDAFSLLVEQQAKDEYYTPVELMYGKTPGTFLSPFDYSKYLDFIDSNDLSYITKLPLKTFNYKSIYYCLGADLISILHSYFSLVPNDDDFRNRFSKTFIESRIFSEIEGTLNVENVPTTRRRLRELLVDNVPVKDRNDLIIKNMKEAIDFVHELPAFTKDNLFKLYKILSNGCLDKENELKPGDYYRFDSVEISHYKGCPVSLIDECMDSLFNFVNDSLNDKNNDIYFLTILPHICHYYVLYIHPYFDYNGRTARMVSYWVYLLTGIESFPPIISEAINQTKNKYYKALENSRDSHNDITYFLKYILNISCDYIATYQNLEYIESMAKQKGYTLTETELNYMKRIMISYEGKFSYGDFLKMANIEITKQGALKILNHFIDVGFLKEVESKSNAKLFDINKNSLLLLLKRFGVRHSKGEI